MSADQEVEVMTVDMVSVEIMAVEMVAGVLTINITAVVSKAMKG